jgi:hypothetical protein
VILATTIPANCNGKVLAFNDQTGHSLTEIDTSRGLMYYVTVSEGLYRVFFGFVPAHDYYTELVMVSELPKKEPEAPNEGWLIPTPVLVSMGLISLILLLLVHLFHS